MRLRRFTVAGFAQLTHVDVEFRDEAPNVIFGLNEAGKSHLMQALCGMFFAVDHPELLVPWAGEPAMRGTLEFVDAEGRLVHLERDFMSAAVTVSVAGEPSWNGRVKGSTSDALRFADCLQRWLGFRDQGLFAATTFVRQADVIMQESGNDGRVLASQVKGLITGTQETSYDRVHKDLEKELDGLRKSPTAHKARVIEVKRAELEGLRALLQTATHDHDRYSRLEHELEQIAHDTERDTAERKSIQQRLADADALMNRETELRRLDTEFQKVDGDRRRLEDLQAKLVEARKTYDRLARFNVTDDVRVAAIQRDLDEAEKAVTRVSRAGVPDPDQLSQLKAAVQTAQRELDCLPLWPADLPIELIREANRAATAAVDRSPEAVSPPLQARWFLAFGVAAIGVVLGALVHPGFFVLVLGAALYGAAMFFAQRPRGTTGGETSPQAAQERLAALLDGVGASTVQQAESQWRARQDATERLSRTTQALDAALKALGVATVAQAIDQYRDAQETRARAQAAHDALLAELGVETIEQVRDGLGQLRAARTEVETLSAKLGMLRAQDVLKADWTRAGSDLSGMRFDVGHLLDQDPELKALGTSEMRAQYVATLKERSRQIQTLIDDYAERERALRLEQADLGRAPLQDIPVLREQIQDLGAELARLERKARALRIAIDELNGAVSHFRDHCLGEVMVDTSEFLQTVTDGRYTSVDVESDSLTPTVITADRRIAAHQLSRGVQDQLYFALRVALARAITRGRTLPLVLDDPFVNFDPVRRERVLLLLRGLVDRTQVILFTCDPWYAECIKPILVLGPVEQPVASSAIVDVA